MEDMNFRARNKSLEKIMTDMDDYEGQKVKGLRIEIPGATVIGNEPEPELETPKEPTEGPGMDRGVGGEDPFREMLKRKKQEQSRGF